MDTLGLALAFVEGLGLILSPCILPILPIMLAASLDGGRRRPFGIITGFIVAFTGFALLSRQILEITHADPDIVRNVALGFLAVFGFVMLSRTLSDKLVGATQGLANVGQTLTARWDRKDGYFSGVAIGALIGLIWTPCAGPIMAAAVVQIIQAKTDLDAALTVVMFALGAGVPMLLIALFGRQIMGRLTFLKTHAYAVRRVLGIVIIAAAALIYEGADVQLLAAANSGNAVTPKGGLMTNALASPYAAPEIVSGAAWLNAPPLKISDLRGKVVLIDFWTYSCINCVRTLSALKQWDAQYRDKGLVIIGVHTPEFAFEQKLENVKTAIEKYGIRYPVVLDNDLATWRAFDNHYWPAHYLIDKEGRVVYTHFGEGDYDVTENNIRILLGLDVAPSNVASEYSEYSAQPTPETYLGSLRADRYSGETPTQKEGEADYEPSAFVPENNWTLGGAWKIEGERIVSGKAGALLRLNFKARKVFLVMGTSNGQPAKVTLTLNGKPLGAQSGRDVQNSTLTINGHALYELVGQPAFQNSLLEIIAQAPGVELYAFTFGG